MKRPILLLIACVAALAGWKALAAPPDRAHLPPDPAWAVHVDCDALRETYIGKYFLYQMYKPEMRSNMLAFQAIFSFDLRTQLHAVTVYNEGPAAKDTIVIIYADFNPDKIITLLKSSENAQVITNKQHLIYVWRDQRNSAGGPMNYAMIEKGFMITGKDRERLCAAIDIVNGSAPNLSGSKALPEMDAAGHSTFVQGTARRLDWPGSDPTVALLKGAKRIKLRAGETDERFDSALTVEVADEAMARQIATVAQGLVALLSLQKDQPKTAGLADKIQVKQNGNTVTVSLAAPSADLIAALKAYPAKKQ